MRMRLGIYLAFSYLFMSILGSIRLGLIERVWSCIIYIDACIDIFCSVFCKIIMHTEIIILLAMCHIILD